MDAPRSKYFPGLIEKAGESAFDAQCIPIAPDVLDIDTYKVFLLERRRLISGRLNEFLGAAEKA